MPRKPNYRFERSERDRQKAAKKAARLAAKQAKPEESEGLAEPETGEETVAAEPSAEE